MIRIVIVVVLLAVIFGYPQFAEDTDGPCGAFVSHVAKISTSETASSDAGHDPPATGVVGLLDGAVANKIVAERYPGIPTQLTCTWLFWQATIDPKSVPGLLQGLRPLPNGARK